MSIIFECLIRSVFNANPMKNLTILLVLLPIAFVNNAQEIASPSFDFAIHPVKSASIGATDLSDLNFLKEVLKDKRIVLLGEQTHGDGATFEAKVRLIKFLHQQLGFEVLAFESGLYDNYAMYQHVTETNYESSPLKESVFRIWSDAHEFEPLLRYIH